MKSNWNITIQAAAGPQFEVLKWLKDHDYHFSTETARKAAQRNRLDIVKWLLDIGCAVDASSSAEFAFHGNLEAVKYLLSMDVVAESTWSAAAEGGQLEVLQYCKDNGYIDIARTSPAVYCAARRNQIRALDWLLDEGT